MSSGAVAQLVARGVQDVHITGDPEISYFNSKHKRHTNFSMFTQEQTLEGLPTPGGISTVKFKRSGDLLGYVNLVVKVAGEVQLITDWRDIIEEAELYIGGRLVDKQDSEFSESIAIDLLATTYSKSYQASLHGGAGSASFFYPFRFFFCESWQSSLPIVALQYQDVELKIKWSSNLNTNYMCRVNSCYICLDKEERNHVASSKRDMLIYQVQKNEPSNDKTLELSFNHPVKFIASSNTSSNNLVSRVSEVKLQINGSEIEEFKTSVPYFTSIPSYYHTEYAASNAENLFFYPFSISTAKYQPTGTLNFSRIDSFSIHCTENIDKPIYAVNYNILRIDKGMAGILYSD